MDTESGAENDTHVLPPTETTMTLDGLTPNTNYSVGICAATSVGCGMPAIVINQTDEDST